MGNLLIEGDNQSSLNSTNQAVKQTLGEPAFRLALSTGAAAALIVGWLRPAPCLLANHDWRAHWRVLRAEG